MNLEKLTILHEHYRDTRLVLQGELAVRERYFYLVFAGLLLALFDIATPDGGANTLADLLAARWGLPSSPDLRYVHSLLWLLLLAFVVRYLQTRLSIERYAGYIRNLEATLSSEIDGAFTGEGDRFPGEYPHWLNIARHLETIAYPIVLSVVAITWTFQQVHSPRPWHWTVSFDVFVTGFMLAWTAMYFVAFRYVSSFYRRRHRQ